MTEVAPFFTRAHCEEFLFQEAALLDAWRLDEWLTLFVPGAIYEVPSAGASEDSDPAKELFYIADDYRRLGQRVERLKKSGAHSEHPHSHTARLVSNVRVLRSNASDAEVTSTFVTYRSKAGVTETYFGHHRHRLVICDGGIRIAAKRTQLAMPSLAPLGRVSIIL